MCKNCPKTVALPIPDIDYESFIDVHVRDFIGFIHNEPNRNIVHNGGIHCWANVCSSWKCQPGSLKQLEYMLTIYDARVFSFPLEELK